MGKSIFDGITFAAIHERVRNQPRSEVIARFNYMDSGTFFREIEPSGYPAIFQHGPTADRNALLHALRERHGDAVIKVRLGNYADPLTYPQGRQTALITLANYLESLSTTASELPAYAGNQPMPSGLVDDLNIPIELFHPQNQYEAPAFWLGPARAVTPLHKDSSDNFAVHVFGAKRWILFPVRDAPLLAMERVDDDPWKDLATSRLDLRGPDGLATAKQSGAVPLEAIVYAGETLYLPAGWSHFVENVEFTLMISLWMNRMQTPGVLRSKQ